MFFPKVFFNKSICMHVTYVCVNTHIHAIHIHSYSLTSSAIGSKTSMHTKVMEAQVPIQSGPVFAYNQDTSCRIFCY